MAAGNPSDITFHMCYETFLHVALCAIKVGKCNRETVPTTPSQWPASESSTQHTRASRCWRL